MTEKESLGHLVNRLRKEKEWTVKEFIDKLGRISKTGEKISAAYITRVEVHGEIPAPDVIIRIAEVLGFNEEKMLEIAKSSKIQRLEKSLEEKYKKAYGLYRTQKEQEK
ncbi:MAG: helix-turn-helix domain-containing protein [Endomicrobiales bacterium]